MWRSHCADFLRWHVITHQRQVGTMQQGTPFTITLLSVAKPLRFESHHRLIAKPDGYLPILRACCFTGLYSLTSSGV
jgi:hypothetical protein